MGLCGLLMKKLGGRLNVQGVVNLEQLRRQLERNDFTKHPTTRLSLAVKKQPPHQPGEKRRRLHQGTLAL